MYILQLPYSAVKAKIAEYRLNIANARDPDKKHVVEEEEEELYKIVDDEVIMFVYMYLYVYLYMYVYL